MPASSSAAATTTAATAATLTYWSWAPNMDKVVDGLELRPPGHPGDRQQAGGGDAVVTKLLTAAKAGSGRRT